MLFQELSPHVHFLSDAAHLLSQSAPETSAFLMRRRNDLLVENDVPVPDAQRQRVCSCCGHILTPGRGGDVLEIEGTDRVRSTKGRGRKAQKTPPAALRGGISKVVTCATCSRRTRLKLEGPPPGRKKTSTFSSHVQQRASGARPDKQAQTDPESAGSDKVSAGVSSKKRAKNRKAGLQALLDQKQGGASSGLGLSLSDFMKK